MDRTQHTPPESPADETDIEVVVIGSGFSGIGMGAQLKREGVRSFVILEKAASVGGTWRDNTYPGCACDISSHLYSFSFALEPNWSRMFPTQPEIRAYLEKCATTFGLRPHLRFGQEVTRATWSDADRRWTVDTAAGARYRARAVVSGMGGLHKPSYPDLPGIDTFAGPAFHSARWRHDVNLQNRRVAVIGTGASAIQFIPQIQPEVGALTVFQRSPPWIFPKLDRPMTELERAVFAAAPALQGAYRRAIWGMNELRGRAFFDQKQMARGETLAKAFLHASVKDPELRAKLTPDYRLGCKRVLISNDYYPAMQQDNVDLVTRPILKIAPDGVITTDGRLHEADVLIFGTGFKPMDLLNPVVVTGRHGRVLNEEWAKRPMDTYWGVTVAGYPNLFLLMGPNTGLGHNSMVFMIESQIAFVMDALQKADAMQADAVDVRPDAQDRFVRDIDARNSRTVWASGCTSWYVSADGLNRTTWPGLTLEYRRNTKELKLEDFEVI